MMERALLARARRLLESQPASAAGQLVRANSKRAHAFAEATLGGKREIRVVLISEGPGNARDRNYYTREAIQDGVRKFNGAPSHLNHPTTQEERERPEKDVRTRCGYFKDTALIEVQDPETGKTVAACEATLVCDESPAGDEALAKAKAAIAYKQTFPDRPEVYTGLSIHSGGWQEGEVEIDGEAWARIVGFDDVRSVDVVTTPARGGAFLRLLESAAPVGDRATRRNAMSKADKIRKLMNDLTEADAKAKATTESKARKAEESKVEALRGELRKLLEEEGEMGGEPGKDGAEKPAAGDGHAEPDGDEPLDGLKKLVPRGADESDEAYTERMAAIKAACTPKGEGEAEGEAEGEEAEGGEAEGEAKPKEGEESEDEAKKREEEAKLAAARQAEGDEGEAEGGLTITHGDGTEVTVKPKKESAVVLKFRKEHPALHREILNGLRESLGAERKDFAGLKKQLAEARGMVAELRLERDLQKAAARLQEAGIPDAYLAPADLIKLDAAAQERQIARMKLALETGSTGRIWTGSGPAPAGKKDGSAAVIDGARAAGIPVK